MIPRLYSDPAFESALVRREIARRQRESARVTRRASLHDGCECYWCSWRRLRYARYVENAS